jgi:outer membrane lipoprotein-sorting protein
MTARVFDFTPKGGNDPILGRLMDPEATIPQDAEDLGISQIDGRDAVGFRLHRKEGRNKYWAGEITDIWVDVETKRVILLETGNPGRHIYIMKDFVFNRELDDSLFGLEPPEGYTIDSRPIYYLAPSGVKKPGRRTGTQMRAPKP